MTSAISATPEACDALLRAAEEHGQLMFHTSGGRVGGRQYPICLPAHALRLGARDHLLGQVNGVPIYEMEDRECGVTCRASSYVLDVAPGPAIGFSIAAAPGKRFTLMPAEGVVCAGSGDNSINILKESPMDAALSEKLKNEVQRVSCTQPSLDLINKLAGIHGPLLFHQSGGCCDGSAPMCYPRGEFKVGAQDIYMGDIGGQPFYMGKSQFEYWQHTHLIIDVVPGRGSGFSVESPEGVRFLTRSRIYTDAENDALDALGLPPTGVERPPV